MQVKEEKIDLEKDIQELTENNLEEIFGLKLITTEFQLDKLRIDTLAYDPETNSFVIIEYKRDRSFSVVDQGFAYLSLMVNNKAEFILEYNEKMNSNLQRGDVDWSQSRVLFVAGSFSPHQQKAIEFKDLPIELWEIELYENNTILYNQLKAPESSESINTVTKSREVKEVSKQVKKYTIDDHFKEGWDKSKKIFDKLRDRILEIDDTITEKALKHYIAYKVNKSNFTELQVQKSGLKIFLDDKIDNFKDPENMLEDCTKVGHWATGDCYFKITKKDQVEYGMFLIKQVYNKFYK
ncbi:MAG: DUF5655 domain-containing protein [Elusimicrobiota bacterium]